MPRPAPTFEGFVGQRPVVERLCRQLDGARLLKDPSLSILLSGESGVGKTTLARAIADYTRTNLIYVNGRDSLSDIAEKIANAKDGDVLLVDEAHGANAKLQEAFYMAIDQSRLPSWAASSLSSEAIAAGEDGSIKIAKVVFVLATDQPGALLSALRKRMQIVEHIEPYLPEEMRPIVDRIATDLKLLLSPQARNHIAEISHGLPRVARHHLQNLRRHYAGDPMPPLSLEDVRHYLEVFEIDSQGFDRRQNQILCYLSTVATAGVEQLARRIGTDVKDLLNYQEPPLLRNDLIRISPGGRSLTEVGKEYLAQKSEKNSEQVQLIN